MKQGYRIITRNYRTSLGEIDIIAQEGDTLAFIEVKTRLGTHFGPPQVAVDIRKQEKISRVALAYLKQYRIASRSCRFDVVAILKKHKDFQVDLIRNAFDGVASP
ncbi:MAG: YraN family protein [Nitrospiria bacterium]